MKNSLSVKNFSVIARLIALSLTFVWCVQSPAAAQEEVQSSLEDVELVETEIEMKDVLSGPVISVEPAMPSSAVALREMQIIELNQTMRNIIEQNGALQKERDRLEGELKFLRGQRTIDQNRLNAIRNEMSKVQQQTNEIVGLNQSYTRQLVDLQNTMKTKETEYQLKIKELQEKVPEGAEADQLALAPASAGPSGMSKRSVEVDVVSMMEEFSKESENLKRDTAKVHYNMGNIFFRKGEYKKAAKEYRKVLELVPADPSAHFNLAFVSGEYLSDPVSALRHYKEYLLLDPDAPDAGQVQEKILEADLAVKTMIDSPIDRIRK